MPAAPSTAGAKRRDRRLSISGLGLHPPQAAALSALVALLAVWLLDVGGPGVAPGIARAVVLLGLAGLAWSCGDAAARLLRRWRFAGAALLVLVALSFAIKLSTLDFELITHARNDEGVYVETAERINEGHLLPRTFNYGHLLYYAGAVVLWAGELFPESTAAAAGALWGADTPLAVTRAWTRAITASFAALTVLPVFWIARRVAGPAAAVLAAALFVGSSIHNELGTLFLSDVPSAFFAALSMACVARLLEGESVADYVRAGAAAGLAAACKYPGGVVVVGIFGIWVYWRLRTRRFSWSLLWAAAATVGAMLLVMPALWLTPERVVEGEGGLGLFFGFYQYAFGGWMGVVPESVSLWYGRHLANDLGWPAALLGLSGAALLGARERRRLLALLPFPVLYLALLFAMKMVVRRNLLPALPMIAVVVGVGLAGWVLWCRRRLRRGWATAAVAALLAVCLAWPAYATTAVAVRRNRPSTGEQAVAWIRQHVPEGAAFVREDYTPALSSERYPSVHRRFAARMPIAEIRDPAWDFLLLSRSAYLRFLDPAGWTRSHHEEFARRYRQMFELELVRDFVPGRFREGPLLLLYRLDPEPVPYRRQRLFLPAEAAWLSDPVLAKARQGRLRYTRRWQYALFKEYFGPGRYRVEVGLQPEGQLEGWLLVENRDKEEIGTFPIATELEVELPRRDKYFLKVFLEPGGQLFGMRWTRSDG